MLAEFICSRNDLLEWKQICEEIHTNIRVEENAATSNLKKQWYRMRQILLSVIAASPEWFNPRNLPDAG